MQLCFVLGPEISICHRAVAGATDTSRDLARETLVFLPQERNFVQLCLSRAAGTWTTSLLRAWSSSWLGLVWHKVPWKKEMAFPQRFSLAGQAQKKLNFVQCVCAPNHDSIKRSKNYAMYSRLPINVIYTLNIFLTFCPFYTFCKPALALVAAF